MIIRFSTEIIVGDVIVMDNARIHFAEATMDSLRLKLLVHGVHLARLPAYSMELNPCEDIFGYVKHLIREGAQSENLLGEVLQALRAVTPQLVHTYFENCIFHKWARV